MSKIKLNPAERVIAWAGGVPELAEILSKHTDKVVNRTTVQQWKQRGKIPIKHTKLLSKLTGIKLIDLIF